MVITVVAAALQGLYKTPIYDLFIDTWGLGGTGETLADLVINSAISFWVFFPIFKSDPTKGTPTRAEVTSGAPLA